MHAHACTSAPPLAQPDCYSSHACMQTADSRKPCSALLSAPPVAPPPPASNVRGVRPGCLPAQNKGRPIRTRARVGGRQGMRNWLSARTFLDMATCRRSAWQHVPHECARVRASAWLLEFCCRSACRYTHGSAEQLCQSRPQRGARRVPKGARRRRGNSNTHAAARLHTTHGVRLVHRSVGRTPPRRNAALAARLQCVALVHLTQPAGRRGCVCLAVLLFLRAHIHARARTRTPPLAQPDCYRSHACMRIAA
jgi:hypothetical protein